MPIWEITEVKRSAALVGVLGRPLWGDPEPRAGRSGREWTFVSQAERPDGCEVERSKELGLSEDWRVQSWGVTGGGSKGLLGSRPCGALEQSTVGSHWRISSWEERSTFYFMKIVLVLCGEWTRGVREGIQDKTEELLRKSREMTRKMGIAQRWGQAAQERGTLRVTPQHLAWAPGWMRITFTEPGRTENRRKMGVLGVEVSQHLLSDSLSSFFYGTWKLILCNTANIFA